MYSLDKFQGIKANIESFDCTLCSFNYGKNLEKEIQFSKIGDPKIENYLKDNPFKSFIDFEDEENEEIEIEGVITVVKQIGKF